MKEHLLEVHRIAVTQVVRHRNEQHPSERYTPKVPSSGVSCVIVTAPFIEDEGGLGLARSNICSY